MDWHWVILRWSTLRRRWEETNNPNDHHLIKNSREMEARVHQLQQADPKGEYCSTSMPDEKLGTAVKLYDYEGEGSCWSLGCTRRPTFEAFPVGRPALVCSPHIQRYLREHVSVRR